MSITESPIFTGSSFVIGGERKDPDASVIMPDKITMRDLVIEYGLVRDLYPQERINRSRAKTKTPVEPEPGKLPAYLTDINVRRRLERAADLGIRPCTPGTKGKKSLR